MSAKVKTYLTVILSVFAFSLPVLIPAASYACSNIQNEIGTGAGEATSEVAASQCGTGSNITQGIGGVAKTVVNILSIVVGIIAVIMIIYGGLRYITSGGESGNVSSAKNTLLFAIIGLVIVAIAQIIVHWVLNTSTTIGNPAGFIHF